MVNRIIGLTLLIMSLGGSPSFAQTYECIIEPNKSAMLGSDVPGVVARIDVQKGQRVRKGEIVATLSSSVESAAVEVARARSESTAALETAKLRQEFSVRKYERALNLIKNNHVSSFELDEAKTETLLAEQSYFEAEESLKLARAEYNRAMAQLEKKSIKSPFEGVVTNVLVEVGERVENDPLMSISQVDPLVVNALLTADQLGKIHVGDKGFVTTELGERLDSSAVARLVDPIVDAASGMFNVEFELSRYTDKTLAGMTCIIELNERDAN